MLAAEQKPDFDKTLDTVKVGDMSYVVFRGQSAPLLGLSYYIVETEIFKSAEHLTVFFCIMAIVFILLAIALSVYFAKLNYKPIYEIAHTLRNLGNNSPDNKNEYKFIKTSIHSLSEQNKRNATIINKHNKLVFNLNLKNYLAGLKSFPKRPSELFSIYQVDFSYANYIVALIIINNVDESVWDLSLGDDELIFSAVDNLFMDFSSVDFNNLYVQIDEYTALLLIGTNLTDRQTIRQAVEKAFWDEHSYSLENVGIDFAAHISDVFSDINDIRQAYTQVKEFHYTNNAIISMYREPDQNGIHDYSIFEKTERLLEKALENSDSKSAEQVLNDLFAEHLSEAPLSFRTFAKIRLLSVFSGMVKFLEPPEVQKYLKLIDNIDSKGVSCKGFIELANLFCQANQNNLEDSRLSNAITKYVKEHFSDSSLNVNTLSYIFDKTPSYLSSIFKSETGKMLNRYIAETRIHNAELLLLSDQKIDLIAEQCGFSDTTTFRRSFKRYLGMTPTEYQKSYKTKENKS